MLLVEDDSWVRASTEEMLVNLGHSVTAVANAAEKKLRVLVRRVVAEA